MHGRGNHARVAVDKGNGFRHRPVSVGIVTLIAITWQPALPIGRKQPERGPSLGPPRIGNHTTLKNDMVDRAVSEAFTHGQPGVAGSDHDGSYRWHRQAEFSVPITRSVHFDGDVGRVCNNIVNSGTFLRLRD